MKERGFSAKTTNQANHTGDLLGSLHGTAGEVGASYGFTVSVTWLLLSPLSEPFQWNVTVSHSGTTNLGTWDTPTQTGSLIISPGLNAHMNPWMPTQGSVWQFSQHKRGVFT